MAWYALLVLAWLPVLYLTALTVAATRRPYPWPPLQGEVGACFPRVIIVIPAHDEAAHIATTVTAALDLDYPRERFAVWVVANACQDDTAARAQAAGARVIEYAPPGKGQALDYAFALLQQETEPWDAALVLDADSVLDRHALQVVAAMLQDGAQAIQLRYAVRNPPLTPRARIAVLQLASLNGLRPAGRDALGWSAGIFGNGFVLTRRTLERVPYRAYSIIEDLEYHQRLQEAGICVRYADAAAVWAEMPETRQQLATQRVRWERGKLQLMRQEWRSVLRMFATDPKRAVARATELYLPPIGWVVLALGLVLVAGVGPARALAAAGMAALMGHYYAAARRYGLSSLFWRTLRHAPFYVLEKFWLVLLSFWQQRKLHWQRTERGQGHER